MYRTITHLDQFTITLYSRPKKKKKAISVLRNYAHVLSHTDSPCCVATHRVFVAVRVKNTVPYVDGNKAHFKEHRECLIDKEQPDNISGEERATPKLAT